MRLLAILAASLLLAAAPALAQQAAPGDPGAKASKKDRMDLDQTVPDRDQQAMTRDLMERTLPFKNGQTLRYYDGEGDLVGTAERNRLTIRFYDPQGNYVGRAERVSQTATNYYDPEGRYLGRRLHKKQTLRNSVTDRKNGYDSSDKGFHSTTKPMGQPGEEE